MKRPHILMVGLAALALFGAKEAEAGSVAKVTFVKGQTSFIAKAKPYDKGGKVADDAPWKRLKSGVKLAEGAAVRTGKSGRLELTLADGSRIRLAPGTTMMVSKASISKTKDRKISLKVWVGRLWANVAKRVAGDSSFEVETANAVAGVRGTSFTVVANSDLSSLVKVYTGTVGVKKNKNPFAGKRRVQIEGPTRIDRKQWEEVIATSMKEVKVTALGQIAPAEDFTDAGEELEWAMWNQERDQAIQ